MEAPPLEERPPPPLVVPAARELGRFGWVWLALGAVLLAVALASGAAWELDAGELMLTLALLGLSVSSVLGAALIARRTGPEILYYRILDRAPPPPPGVPCETRSATTRRVIPPAIALAIVLLVFAVPSVVAMLGLAGEPRPEILEDLPGGALLVSAGWTLTCGAAALRMGFYFKRWERLRHAQVLCEPLKAGTMRPVYWVERRGE